MASLGRQAGPLKTRHAVGLPDGPQALLPFAELLVIETSRDGVYLFRYTADGEFCGDSWHQSIEDAKDQAEYEYERALGQWYDVPTRAEDPIAYAHSVGLLSRPEV